MKRPQRGSKLKQQDQRYILCSQGHFCLHSKWCSEVKGHTCTRLHQELGRRRQWGRTAGRSQRGVPAEDDLQLGAVQFPSVRQSHDALLVPPQSCWVHVLREMTRAHARSEGTQWSMDGTVRCRGISGCYQLYIWQVAKQPELINQ